MRNRGELFLLSFLFVIFLAGFAIAANETNSSGAGTINTNTNLQGVEKGYQCLKNEIESKSSLSFEEAVFSVLALGGNAKAINKVESEKKSGEDCWGQGNCNVKDTSLALLAYDRIGRNTEGIEKWLLKQNGTATDLSWFLEIDIQNHGASVCRITYDGSEKKVNVREDFTLTGSPGSCLDITSDGYLLRVRDACIGKKIEINCDDDFITTLLYQKGVSGTIFVSDETHSASGLGTTSEKVISQCFRSGNKCDYESTLWGTLALNEAGEGIKGFLPYLLALSEDNIKYFPSSFLYILTSAPDQYSRIIQSQKNNKYWEIAGSPGNRFYDTSLGMLALGGTSSAELENSKSYLLEIQQENGCWDNKNIKSTAFLLYSGWPRGVSGADGGGIGKTICEPANGYCEAQFSCLDSGGIVKNEYDCSDFRSVCCSVNVQEKSCTEQRGVICASNQKCDGATTSSVEGSCCLSSCTNIDVVENECENSGGNCRVSCFNNEEENADSCTISGDVCCVEGTEGSSKGISTWVWILLILLIILVILGIIFRNKIRLWMYKRRGDISSRPLQVPRGGPRGPFGAPQGFMRRPMPMFSRGPNSSQARRAPASRTNNEFDETMRKLQEMSK